MSAPRMRLLEVIDGHNAIAWQTERFDEHGPSLSHLHLSGDSPGHWHPGPIQGGRLSYNVLADTEPEAEAEPSSRQVVLEAGRGDWEKDGK